MYEYVYDIIICRRIQSSICSEVINKIPNISAVLFCVQCRYYHMNVNNEWNKFMIFFPSVRFFLQFPLFYYSTTHCNTPIMTSRNSVSMDRQTQQQQQVLLRHQKNNNKTNSHCIKLSYFLHTLHIFVSYDINEIRTRDFSIYIC